MIDHTLLKPDATRAQVAQLCSEAIEWGMGAVCVNPTWITTCADLLQGSDVNICTVVGFPLGAMTTQAKACEAKDAVAAGATEVDMVINIGAVKDGDWALVESDIAAVVKASAGALVKVILETCLLTDEEIVRASQAAVAAGADFVKTSTGFSTGGATAHAVALMRDTVGPDFGVKASGGIRTAADFNEMVKAGANRIGASAGKVLIGE
ncbi:deoxyribose-phosphate aldolase [Arcanobacterium pluranimalium]|uniref:deoxyribose-phosphate aldolase n=1 Tax=Arcanobacterium pluranimalium TaxID=108028 RepID=UPI001EF91F92|nr:deoxyribose-phosphate aldolase [Arcanobacterium pluranimalium]